MSEFAGDFYTEDMSGSCSVLLEQILGISRGTKMLEGDSRREERGWGDLSKVIRGD